MKVATLVRKGCWPEPLEPGDIRKNVTSLQIFREVYFGAQKVTKSDKSA